MSGNFQMDAGYVDVATRLVQFREAHPEGSLQPVNQYEPVTVVTVGDKTFLQYVAAAYRNPEDPRPGIGIAWELFPGRTPYTRDSEAQNAETSAWGRAIVAALAADTRKGVASADEVKLAQERRAPLDGPAVEALRTEAQWASSASQLNTLAKRVVQLHAEQAITDADLESVKAAVTARRAELATPAPGGAAAVSEAGAPGAEKE